MSQGWQGHSQAATHIQGLILEHRRGENLHALHVGAACAETIGDTHEKYHNAFILTMSRGFRRAQLARMTNPGGTEITPIPLGNASGQPPNIGAGPRDAATSHMNRNHHHTRNQQQASQHKPMAKSWEEMERTR